MPLQDVSHKASSCLVRLHAIRVNKSLFPESMPVSSIPFRVYLFLSSAPWNSNSEGILLYVLLLIVLPAIVAQ